MEGGGKSRSSKSKTKMKDSRYVPYARGFKVPAKVARMKAIGFDVDGIPPQYHPSSDTNFFTSVPQPTSIDDWLAQYDEEGQTYSAFLDECPWLSTRKVTGMKHRFVSKGTTMKQKYPEGKIYIVPVGNFDGKSGIVFDDLVDYANRFLCLPVAVLPEMKLEFSKDQLFLTEEASVHPSGRKSRARRANIDIRYHSKSKHLQIDVVSVLRELRRKIPQDALCVIGLTMHDLYGDDTDLFVAGMAAGNHNVAVFSVLRYDPRLTFSKEFWYDIKQTEKVSDQDRQRLVLQRSCKLVVHEINHLLGIDHCIYFDCCMNGSGHLAEDFRQPMHLCPVDLHKLEVLTGMDVTDRYKKLLEFYKKHGMESEAAWVERRILYIQEEAQKQGKAIQLKSHDLEDTHMSQDPLEKMEASGKTRKKSRFRSRKSRRYVPYVKGFQVPTIKERTDAIGFDTNNIPPQYRPISDITVFAAIPRPTSIDDWLAQYNVKGQSFSDYVEHCPWMSNIKYKRMDHKFVPDGKTLCEKYPEGKIYVVQVGNFDENSCFDFAELVDYARRYLCLPIKTLPALKLEFSNQQLVLLDDPDVSPVIKTRYNSEFKHFQMDVGVVLSELNRNLPPDALGLIGLTMYDLYGGDTDLFVAGMASGKQNVAIFSVHRYDPRLTFSTEFWYDINKTESVSDQDRRQLILQRSCKLVVHEICHLLGIGHCIYFDCCMNGSGHLAEDFRQPMHLCPVDLHKLQVLTGMDVTDRYKKLLEFYKKHGMESEVGWVERRILFIQAEEHK
ncbi:LOW QUALITY PROTEIN: uncharacterized protein LOC124274932 [Haliotis rubra]|uniref:LOW QUALITY PROTEIN: uncharacterized protein LOC124274932 n=1 Tax=Haliotis rubra TaxID=36100 RepID=UPI001EE5E55C|nr:LOW QUALITY PROTEIN: uncharacterized protein LOC124274932 [Haliotis rubra]